MRQANWFGFKLWCLAPTAGYLCHAAPHCGAGSKLSDMVFGQGADAVLNLAEKDGLLKVSCYH